MVENPGNKSKKMKVYFTGLDQNDELDCAGDISSEDELSSASEENDHKPETTEVTDSAQKEMQILKQKLKEKEKEILKLKKRTAELETKKEELEIEVSNVSLDNEMFKKAYRSEKKERMRIEDLLERSSTSESSSSNDSSDEDSTSEEEYKRKRKPTKKSSNQSQTPKRSNKKYTEKKQSRNESNSNENTTDNMGNAANNPYPQKLMSFSTENRENMPRRPVCKFYINGQCNRNPCRFFHPRRNAPNLEMPQGKQPIQEIINELKNMRAEFQQDIRHFMDVRAPGGLQGFPIRQTFYQPRTLVGSNGYTPMQMHPPQIPIQTSPPQNVPQSAQS